MKYETKTEFQATVFQVIRTSAQEYNSVHKFDSVICVMGPPGGDRTHKCLHTVVWGTRLNAHKSALCTF